MATFLAILPKCCQNRLAEVSSAMLPPIEDLPLAWVSSRSGSVSGTGGLAYQGLRIRWGEVLVFVGDFGFLWRWIECHPTVAVQFDFHPCGHVVAGEFRDGGCSLFFGAAFADFTFVVFWQESEYHTAGKT